MFTKNGVLRVETNVSCICMDGLDGIVELDRVLKAISNIMVGRASDASRADKASNAKRA